MMVRGGDMLECQCQHRRARAGIREREGVNLRPITN